MSLGDSLRVCFHAVRVGSEDGSSRVLASGGGYWQWMLPYRAIPDLTLQDEVQAGTRVVLSVISTHTFNT